MLDAFYRRRQALEVSCTERPWCMDAPVTPGTGRGAGVSGAGAMTPYPAWVQAMRTKIGRPSSSMRFRAWTATSNSVARRWSVRERNPSPINCLNLPMAAWARARALYPDAFCHPILCRASQAATRQHHRASTPCCPPAGARARHRGPRWSAVAAARMTEPISPSVWRSCKLEQGTQAQRRQDCQGE